MSWVRGWPYERIDVSEGKTKVLAGTPFFLFSFLRRMKLKILKYFFVTIWYYLAAVKAKKEENSSS